MISTSIDGIFRDRRSPRGAFIVALLLLGTVSGTALWNLHTEEESAQGEKQTWALLMELKTLLLMVRDAESGQRGYVITGDKTFLHPYQRALSGIDASLEKLRNITATEKRQQEHIREIKGLIRQKLLLVGSVLAVRETSGFEAARSIMARGTGKALMDAITGEAGRMEAEERQLLEQQSQERKERSRKGLIAVAAETTIGFSLLILTFAFLQREIALRGKAAEELRVHREQLEEVVRLRTGEIAKVVDDLKESQFNLIKTKEEAEAANLAKSRFLANMSHEMRTPLAGVLGMVELVLQSPLSDEQQRLLSTAKNSAEALLRLIADILDFSAGEAGQLVIEQKPFNIRALIASVAGFFRLQVEAKALRMIVDVDDAVPVTLSGDQGRLRQVLIHVLGNAVKFTNRGEIEIRIELTRTAGYYRITIRDTGIGIPDHLVGKIFGLFSQIDESNTRRYGGTGLGLALSRAIINRMGGDISVSSREGVGSTFVINLPLIPL